MKKDSLHVAAALIIRNHKVLLARKAPHKSNGGLWEFPGGKMEENESVFACVEREIREELGLEVKAVEVIGQSLLESGHHELILYGVVSQGRADPSHMLDHDMWGWFSYDEICTLALAPADIPLLPELKKYLDNLG